MRLTAVAVDKLKPDAKRREIPDDLCRGLYLVVQPSGARSWAIRYRRKSDNKPRKLTLGSYPAIGLADARERAQAVLRGVATGGDPAARADEAKVIAAGDFGTVMESFLVRGAAHTRSVKETRRLLEKHVLPFWRRRSIADIGRGDVVEVLWRQTDRGVPILANRIHAHLRRLFAWSVEVGILTASPMQGLKRPSPERSRERVLSDDELVAVWRAGERLGHPFGPLVRLLILTGQRRDEVAGLTWDELDIEAALWTLPAARSKNGDAHRVPLAPPALAIIAGVPRVQGCAWLFSSTRRGPVSGFSAVKQRLDKVSGAADWTLHNIRRTVATGMARLGVAPHVADRVLGHRQGTIRGVAAIYNRHAYDGECRAALELWAGHVLGLLARPGNVIPLVAAGNGHQ